MNAEVSEVRKLGRAVSRAAISLRHAIADLARAVHPQAAHHDDAAELVTRLEAARRTVRAADEEAVERLLDWLLRNDAGHREIRVGERVWWAEREKSERLRDLPATLATLTLLRCREAALVAMGGDEEAADGLLVEVAGSLAALISSGGLKPGACRAVLGDGGFREHWEVRWGDRLKADGTPNVKLGVGHLRFMKQDDRGRSAKELADVPDAKSRGAALHDNDEGEG